MYDLERAFWEMENVAEHPAYRREREALRREPRRLVAAALGI